MNRQQNQSAKPLILIVDDNSKNLQVLGATLSGSGYDVSIASNGPEAMTRLTESYPDLILLDVMMPGVDGYQVCRDIKNDATLANIPIIFLTARVAEEDIISGFNAGAVDYVSKPFRKVELLARVQTHVALRRSYRDLERARQELEIIANTDPLTKLSNRRHMLSVIEKERSRSDRICGKFYLVLCDIDHFKLVNDNYGHDMGDRVLQMISSLGVSLIRHEDTFARWGGEEFLFLLPESNETDAKAVAEKVRKAVEKLLFDFEDKQFHVTMTLGVSEYDKQSLDDCLCEADKALYHGKENGRNCVVSFCDL